MIDKLWYTDEGKTYSGFLRVVVLDVIPPRLLFMKDFYTKDGELCVETTYDEYDAMIVRNEPNDELLTQLFEDIKNKYKEYNPSVIEIETTSKVLKFYGDNSKFFHYNILFVKGEKNE